MTSTLRSPTTSRRISRKALEDPARHALLVVDDWRAGTLGNPGDVREVGSGVSELRIPCGPGYRVYFITRGKTLVILLAGGDKRTQTTDIRAAIELARTV
jgi:putative addiction module killer protein